VSAMNWKAVLFAVVVLILLLVVMFYSGMFMHGDPIEPPPYPSGHYKGSVHGTDPDIR
jgi:hypothetical protein